MRRTFHKMHGLGNDFVIVDAREQPFDVTPPLARAVAHRRTGVRWPERDELEEQQRHLNVGLEKLRDTFEKVRVLRASLDEKKTQLRLKDDECHVKLQQLVENNKLAEDQKRAAVELSGALQLQKADVEVRKRDVAVKLADIEPAVELAKRFSTDNSGRFVTGVLAALASQLRSNDPGPGTE